MNQNNYQTEYKPTEVQTPLNNKRTGEVYIITLTLNMKEREEYIRNCTILADEAANGEEHMAAKAFLVGLMEERQGPVMRRWMEEQKLAGRRRA